MYMPVSIGVEVAEPSGGGRAKWRLLLCFKSEIIWVEVWKHSVRRS